MTAPVGPQIIMYYCASCRKRVFRNVKRANKFYPSFCEKAGKKVRMRKMKVPFNE